MISRVNGSNTYTLSYDAENRLTSVGGGATATFVYDGDGERVKGTVGNVSTFYAGSAYEIRPVPRTMPGGEASG